MSDQSPLEQDPQRRLRLAARTERPQAPAAKGGAPAPAPLGFVPQDISATVETHLLDYVKVVYKRRWMAMTAFLLVLGSVTVYTFSVTPIFESRTRLLIEAENPNVVSFKEVIDEDQTKADYYQTQYNILQSRALARKTVESLKLWDHPLLGAEQADRSSGVKTAAAGAARWVSGLFSTAARGSFEVPAADETAAQSKTIDAFLEGLMVSPIRNSRLVDVKFRSADPALATSVVNSLAKNYIEQTLEYKFLASKEATDWLGERLSEQRKQVEAAETKLQAYREHNDAISLEDRQNIVVQKLADLNAAVTRAKTERIQKESMYNQLRSIQTNSAALDTFPAILTNTFIQQQKTELAQLQQTEAQLSEKFGDKHPEIVKMKSAIQTAQLKLQTEINKVVQSVRTEYQAALAQENSMADALSQQKGEALSMNRKGIEYSVLDREVQSSKQLYESLMQRAKETGVSSELKSSNIRIIDQAERPRSPVVPRKGLSLMLGFLVRDHPRLRTGVLLRVPGQPHQDAGRAQGAPRSGRARHGTGARQEGLEWQGAADSHWRAAEFRRGLPHHPHQRAVLVGGGGLANDRRHEHRPRRRQDYGGEQSGNRIRTGRPARAADRRRHAPAARARDVRAQAGAGALQPDGGQREGERERAQDRGARTVGAGGGSQPAQPGGAAWIAALPRLPDLAEGALRFILVDSPPVMAVTDAAIAAALRVGRRVRRRRRDDQPAHGARRAGAARAGSRPLHRRHPESRRAGTERLLLLALLPPRVRRLLPASRQRKVGRRCATRS